MHYRYKNVPWTRFDLELVCVDERAHVRSIWGCTQREVGYSIVASTDPVKNIGRTKRFMNRTERLLFRHDHLPDVESRVCIMLVKEWGSSVSAEWHGQVQTPTADRAPRAASFGQARREQQPMPIDKRSRLFGLPKRDCEAQNVSRVS